MVVPERAIVIVLLRDLDALLDGGRNFLGLAGAEAHLAGAVADDDQRAEAEVLTALDDLGDAIDVDDLVDHPAVVALFSTALAARTTLSGTLPGTVHWTLHVIS
jgi:hypothetical protein